MPIHKKTFISLDLAKKRKGGRRTPRRQGYFPGNPAARRRPDLKDTRLKASGKLSNLFANRRLLAFILAGAVLVLTGAWLLSRSLVRDIRQRQAETEARAIYHQAAAFETAGAVIGLFPEAASADDNSPEPLLTAAPDPAAAGMLRSSITSDPRTAYPAADRFSSLREMNSDIVGWLEIRGLVDLPVLKRDNSYYLTHDYLGRKSESGALFLDGSMDVSPQNETLVIHGHNMRDGSMFGKLPKYGEKSFYTAHWLIHFDTLFESGEYAVFAALNVSTLASDSSYFPFLYSGFDSNEQFMAYIEFARQRSVFRCGIDVTPADALLMLSTCFGGDDNYFLVIARKIRPGENVTTLLEASLHAEFLQIQ